MVQNTYDIGVIVGRFQVHELHEGHKTLIENVMNDHRRVLIFLGVTSTLLTKNNPLDFIARKEMLHALFPQLTVLSLPDMQSDFQWSRELDRRIREACPVGSVLLYGGRDSFIPFYHGAFHTRELMMDLYVSGTDIRREISRRVIASPDFRAGVIYAAYNQYPTVFPTVDVAILHGEKILLGKKPHDRHYRFIGGFSDPSDDSFEEAARREAKEETGLEINQLSYAGSAKIDDWRYSHEDDKIITHLFLAQYAGGAPVPNDDIESLEWFVTGELKEEDFVEEHRVLFRLFTKALNSEHK